MKLLIIRPQPAAKHSAAAAIAAGMEAEIAPLFTLAPAIWTPPDPYAFDGLLLTSANAMRYGGAKLEDMRDLPVLAVGKASADAARQHGFAVAITGETDKAGLLEQAKTKGFARLLWLAGKHRTAAVANEDLIAERITIYESTERPAPPNFAEILDRCDAVLLHSPRAAQHFANEVTKNAIEPKQISIAALSPAVAEAAGTRWRELAVAKQPSDDALLLAVQSIAT